MGTRVATVNDILDGHVGLDLECFARIYLNGWVPHLGFPIPSPAILEKIGLRFRKAVTEFAADNDIEVIRFAKGERKLEVMRPHLERAAGPAGAERGGRDRGGPGEAGGGQGGVEHTIGALDPHDRRLVTMWIAGPAALLVAKPHKIAERVSDGDRVQDKDALDVLRLLRTVRIGDLVARLRRSSTPPSHAWSPKRPLNSGPRCSARRTPTAWPWPSGLSGPQRTLPRSPARWSPSSMNCDSAGEPEGLARAFTRRVAWGGVLIN